jgi:hypothetical protein
VSLVEKQGLDPRPDVEAATPAPLRRVGAEASTPAGLAATGRVERSGQLGRDENVQRLGRRVSRRP